MKTFTFGATSAALFLVAGGWAVAADPPKPGVPLTPVAVPTFRAKQVLGTRIALRNGTAIGTVDDIVFDDAGNLDYLIVATEDSKLVTLPWEAAKFDLEKKTGVVSITPEVYKTIPTYTVTTYPAFYTPGYRADIYKVYGLTPRELRRLERRLP
jgi:sporulation protein YlmC with PRC-barrel domain